MGEARLGKFKKIDKKLEFSNRIVDVYTEKIITPVGREVNWVLIKQKRKIAAIIPVDTDDNIIFVRQYRNTADDYVLEIPAGGIESDEDIVVGAKRELREETGYIANSMTHLVQAYSSIGFLDEPIHYYLAEDLTLGDVDLDPDEYVIVEKYSLETAIDMIYNGEIVDGKTVLAIMLYSNYKNNLSKNI